MAEWRELCLHEDVERLIMARIERSELAAKMLRAVQREVISRTDRGAGQVGEVAREHIKATGLETQLQNLVYQELMQLQSSQRDLPLLPPALHCKEPLSFLQSAQEDWEDRMRRKLNSVCAEIGGGGGGGLAKERSLVGQQWIQRRWNGLGANYPVPKELHQLYSPADLLRAIVQTQSPNLAWDGVESGMGCGLMNFHLGSKSLFDLREVYSILSRSHSHIEALAGEQGEAAYHEKTLKVISKGLSSLAREACKRGCPSSLRRQLWSCALGVEPEKEEHAFHFEKLKSSVIRTYLFVEKLIVKEVKETTASDDAYFVFEDTILQVLFAFLHDYSTLHQLEDINITPLRAHIQDTTGECSCEVVYPPNGIIPFQGISSYVAPLCYIFSRADRLYAFFKQLYLRFFVHLHTMSSHHQGIVGLCCLFESLLHSRQPELFSHLTDIRAHPLQLVYGWLSTAFASQLDCREVLLLWDRIIGFNSVEVLAVLAVAVLEFRAANLFTATSLSEAESILSDLRCLKVLPLLQQTLFL